MEKHDCCFEVQEALLVVPDLGELSTQKWLGGLREYFLVADGGQRLASCYGIAGARLAVAVVVVTVFSSPWAGRQALERLGKKGTLEVTWKENKEKPSPLLLFLLC